MLLTYREICTQKVYLAFLSRLCINPECVFINSALKIQCHIVNDTLLQTAFSAILPTWKITVCVCKEEHQPFLIIHGLQINCTPPSVVLV